MTRTRAVATAAVVVLASAAVLTGIWDPDFFHHLAVGRAILRGTSFAEDPFVFTLQGAPASLPPYWLGSVVIYLASLPDTLLGPQLLVALLTAGLCVLLLEDALEERRSLRDVAIAAALVLLALPELRVRSAPRPEAFGVLGIAYTMLALRRFERGRPRLLLAFPLVALLWSQLHVSVIIGVGLVGLHLAWTLVRVGAARLGRAWAAGATLEEARRPAIVVAAAAVAAALNPSTASPVRIGLGFLGALLGIGRGTAAARPDAARIIWGIVEELNFPSLADWGRPFGVLILLALASFALHRSKHWGRELAAVAVLGYFTSTSFRFATLAAVVAVPIAARNLLAWLDAQEPRRPRIAHSLAAILVVAGLARAVTAPTLAAQHPTLGLDVPSFPVRAADYLRRIGFDGRLYNEFGAGGYLEWILDRKVFQDGRGTVTPEDVPYLFPEPIDRTRLSFVDARWHFDALVMGTRPPIGNEPGVAGRISAIWATVADPAVWAPVAMDEGATLYLRRASRWGAYAARDELRLVKPGVLLPDAAYADPATMRDTTQELARLVADAPYCAQCRIGLAGLLLQAARLPEAAPHLELLDRTRDLRVRATVDLLLATRAQMQGDLAASERHFRDAIRHSTEPAAIRRALAMQLVSTGQAAAARVLVDENLAAARTSADLGLAAQLARSAGDAATAARLEGEASTVQRREVARLRGQEGSRLLDEGRTAEARAAFEEARSLDPTLPEPLVGLGFLELMTAHPEVAAGLFEQVRKARPDDADAAYGLGLASEALKRPERAVAAYRDLLRIRPRGTTAEDARTRIRRLEGR